jgi:hypothetical protein
VFRVASRWQAPQQRKGRHQLPRQLGLLYLVVLVKEVVEANVVHYFHSTRFLNLCVSGVSLVAVLVSVSEQELVLSSFSCQVGEEAFRVEEEGAHVPSQAVGWAHQLIHLSSDLGAFEWHSSPISWL